jgi:hypothetical protein
MLGEPMLLIVQGLLSTLSLLIKSQSSTEKGKGLVKDLAGILYWLSLIEQAKVKVEIELLLSSDDGRVIKPLFSA